MQTARDWEHQAIKYLGEKLGYDDTKPRSPDMERLIKETAAYLKWSYPALDRERMDNSGECYCHKYRGYMCLKHSRQFHENYNNRLVNKVIREVSPIARWTIISLVIIIFLLLVLL